MYSKITKINNLDITEYLEKYVYPYTWYETERAMYDIINYLDFGLISEKIKISIICDKEEKTYEFTRKPAKQIKDNFLTYKEKT